MKTIHFKSLRRITWCLILALIIYLLVNALFEPSRAALRSENEGSIVYLQILWANIYALVECLILLLIGIAAVTIYHTLRKSISYDFHEALMCLSEFIFAASIWVLTDSHFLSFVTSKTNAVALLSYLSFTTMFAFLFEFVGYVMGKIPHLNLFCCLLYILAGLQICYFIKPLIPALALVIPVHAIGLAGACMIIYCGQTHEDLKKRNGNREIIRGFMLLLFFAVVTMVIFYLNPTMKYTLPYSIGVCVFCAYLFTAALYVVQKQIRKEADDLAYRRLAYTDVMTNLMNKAAYIEEENKPLTKGCIYLMMDLNNLKEINDTFGHRAGDEVIIAAADYIRRFFDRGLCYRFGGDEFIVICRDYTLPEVLDIIKEMRETMEEDNKNRKAPVRISVGYSVYTPEDTVETMFHRADRSMYEDKKRQKAGR